MATCDEDSFLSCAWGKCINTTAHAGTLPVLAFEVGEMRCVCDEGFVHDTILQQQYNCTVPERALQVYLAFMISLQSALLIASAVQWRRTKKRMRHVVNTSVMMNVSAMSLQIAWVISGGVWTRLHLWPMIGNICTSLFQLTVQIDLFLELGSSKQPRIRQTRAKLRRIMRFKVFAATLILGICYSLTWVLFWGKRLRAFNISMLVLVQTFPIAAILDFCYTLTRATADVVQEFRAMDATPGACDPALIKLLERLLQFSSLFTRAACLGGLTITTSLVTSCALGFVIPFQWATIGSCYLLQTIGLTAAPLLLISQGEKHAKTTKLSWLRGGGALASAETGLITEHNAAFARLLAKDGGDGGGPGVENGTAGEQEKQEPEDFVGSDVYATAGLDAGFRGETEVKVGARWVRVSAHEHETAVFVEAHDVTERRLAVERVDIVLDTSFDGFFDWHMTKDYEYMSPAFWRMFGFEPHEKAHHPSSWMDLIYQEDLEVATVNLNRHIETKGAHPYMQRVRYRHKTRRDAPVTVLCKGRVIEWDEETGAALRMVGTHTDVSHLDATTAELAAKTLELSQLMEVAGVPVFAVDEALQVTEWNGGMVASTGIPREEAVGRALRSAVADDASMAMVEEVIRLQAASEPPEASSGASPGASPEASPEASSPSSPSPPSSPPTPPTARGTAAAAIQPMRRAVIEPLFRSTTGAPREMHLTSVAYRGKAFFVGSDVTDLLVAKAAILSEKERADAERGLNEYLSHEVRNPLTVCLSAVRFLSAHLTLAKFEDDAVARTCEEDVQLLHTSLVFINSLLSKLLDLNKFSAAAAAGDHAKKGRHLELAPMSIRDDVLKPVHAMLDRSVSGITMNIKCSEPLWVEADALRLQQICMNLAKNSLKFVSKGFINLVAYRTVGVGDVGDHAGGHAGDHEGADRAGGDLAGGDYVVIAVEDSGPGISPEKRGHLFQKYQESLDQLRQGTGIGLCLCKVLASNMGGGVALDDSYDSGLGGLPGARFVVTLPLPAIAPPLASLPRGPGGAGALLDAAAGAASASSIDSSLSSTSSFPLLREAARIVFGGSKVLIVDDDALVRLVMRRRLAGLLRVEVEEAASGEVATCMLSACPAPRFSVIFVDHYMPGVEECVTGDEVVRRIRAMEDTDDVVVVGCSANDVSALHLAAGADLFMRKPLPSDDRIASALLGACRLPTLVRVLLVDDDAVNILIYKRTLAKVLPAAIITDAADAAGALALDKDQHFDLILLDEQLGAGLTGSQVAPQLRALHPRAVLISLSAMHTHCHFARAITMDGDCDAGNGNGNGVEAAGGDADDGHNEDDGQRFDLYWPKPLPSFTVLRAHITAALLGIAKRRNNINT